MYDEYTECVLGYLRITSFSASLWERELRDLFFGVELTSTIKKNNRSDSSKMTQIDGVKPLTAVQKLRVMLSDPEKFIVCPGVYDGYTARIALQEGADCLYMVRPHPPHLPLHRTP